MAGGPITRKDVKRGLCRALKWSDDSIDRILRGEEPIDLRSGETSADTIRIIKELASLMEILAQRARDGEL